MLEIYFDGGCRPLNPGKYAVYGYVIRRDGETAKEGNGVNISKGKNARMTNNIAEYSGLVASLEALKALQNENEFDMDLDEENVIVRGDSALIINQVLGKFKTKSRELKKLRVQVISLLEELGTSRFQFEWIEREENKEADALATKAYKKLDLNE